MSVFYHTAIEVAGCNLQRRHLIASKYLTAFSFVGFLLFLPCMLHRLAFPPAPLSLHSSPPPPPTSCVLSRRLRRNGEEASATGVPTSRDDGEESLAMRCKRDSRPSCGYGCSLLVSDIGAMVNSEAKIEPGDPSTSMAGSFPSHLGTHSLLNNRAALLFSRWLPEALVLSPDEWAPNGFHLAVVEIPHRAAMSHKQHHHH